MPRRLRRLLPLVLLAWLVSTRAGAQGGPESVPGEILIRYRPGVRTAERASLRREIHARRLHDFPFIQVEHLVLDSLSTEAAIARYRSDPRVAYVEPNYVVHADLTPNDSRFPEQYGLRNTGQTGGTPGADIHAVSAWDVFTGDPELKVGSIDSGVDYSHADLAANMWTNAGETPDNGTDDDGNGYVDDIHGYDFVHNDGDPFDDFGHGTHTSGTIAAVGNNGEGVTGVAWRARIVAIKFLNAQGSGTIAAAIAALEYAIAVGCRVTNNSWGGGAYAQAMVDAIDAAGAAGQLFVAAAGNARLNLDTTPSYPAAYDSPYILSVAALDARDSLASFSNYGATTVDLGAPGVDVLSTLPGNRYGLVSGTSMAAPLVTGVVALAMGHFPTLPNLAVKALILGAVDPAPALAGKCVTGGRLNAFQVVAEPDSTPPGAVTDLAVTAPGSTSVDLAWTATGDDGGSGRASRYEIRHSQTPITPENFAAATLVPGTPDPSPAGITEHFRVTGLTFLTTYHLALRALDEFGNAGPLSNVAGTTTLGAPRLAFSPDTLKATLQTGEVTTRTLTLSNTADGVLDFTLPTPVLAFAQSRVYAPVTGAKGDDGPPGEAVAEGRGGPDGFGYRWSDSDQPGGPSFDWVELAGTAAPLLLNGDDQLSAPVPIGFEFPFYGATFGTVRVCTNGYLSFTDVSVPYINQPLPSPGAPANLVAPFWDDLDFGAARSAYAWSDGSRFIVEYVAVPHFNGGGPYTFEVQLFPTGEIRYQYLRLGFPTASATVGIQDATGSMGMHVVYNGAYLHDSLAVKLLRVPQWVTVAPAQGRIPGGESRDVEVRFEAVALAGGSYAADVEVQSNDPLAPSRLVPVRLRAVGAPDLRVVPAALDFDTVFVGAQPARTLTLSNSGTDVLEVSALEVSDPAVGAGGAPFTLARFASRALAVSVSPAAPGPLDATLTIRSNDPDSPAMVVPVTATVIPAPSVRLEPESLEVALVTNTATARAVRVSNAGGSDYVFTAGATDDGPPVVVHGDADTRPVAKGEGDVQFGPAPLRAGGPDGFGYTYRDSDEPDGPGFAWEDVRITGAALDLYGDDVISPPIAIGFEFPFYGAAFTQVRVCTNGFLSFTSSKTSFSNTSLPNNGAAVPENLLAPFWDDLSFPSPGHVFARTDGTRLVIQYQDVARIGEGANPNTFEVILHADGRIDYQYLAMRAANRISATIGMQNAARDDGLQVAFNAPYVKDSLAIRFTPPTRWLTVTPAAGVVPPGGALDLTVGFNAGGLFGGTYRGSVRLSGNDPLAPAPRARCRLEVSGRPVLEPAPAALDFGEVFLGLSRPLTLTLRNRGSDVLHVSKIWTSDARYALDRTAVDVAPFDQRTVAVTFAPNGYGEIPATLTVLSDDPDLDTLTVALTGAGVDPPLVAVAPAALEAALAPVLGDRAAEARRTLVLRNEGGSDLAFRVSARADIGITQQGPPLDAEGPKGDPGVAGSLGAGAPDAGGYRWLDNDEPGGPAFDWVDVRGLGTPVPLDDDDQTSAPIALPFPFTFYGNRYDSVRVCTNGFASFTSRLITFTNTALPNAGRAVPENLLAVFWDDQDFRPQAGAARAYTFHDGSRFIIAFHDVPHLAVGGPYTYEILLYPDGTVDYQYLRMSGRNSEATIGIQNADRTVGQQVAYNAYYVHDGLRVRFTRLPPWLTVAPDSGRVPPGGADTLEVRFGAAGYADGDYHGEIRIDTNALTRPLADVPVRLHVGVARATCRMTPRTLSMRGNPHVRLAVATPGYDVRAIRTSSLRINRTAPVAPGQPVRYRDSTAIFLFSIHDLLPVVGVGRAVPIEASGEVEGDTWFTAMDTIRVRRPRFLSPMPVQIWGSGQPTARLAAGTVLPLAWEEEPGDAAERWEIWFSPDRGTTWSRVAANLAVSRFDWELPGLEAAAAMLEIVGTRAGEVVSAWLSDPFAIVGPDLPPPPAALPARFGLDCSGCVPARGMVELTLAVPAPAEVEVRVFDVRGALVRTLARGAFVAGKHALVWDGMDRGGRAVSPGLYFVQAVTGGSRARVRVVMIR